MNTPNPAGLDAVAADVCRAALAGPDNLDVVLDVIRPEHVPAVLARVARVYAATVGPVNIDDEVNRTGSLALVAAVQAAMDEDYITVEALRPETLAEALVQVNAAVRVCAYLLAGTSDEAARRWVEGLRAVLVTPATLDGLDALDVAEQDEGHAER